TIRRMAETGATKPLLPAVNPADGRRWHGSRGRASLSRRDRPQSGAVASASAPAVELSALLDRQRHVMDVARNVRCRLQSHHCPTNDARDLAAHEPLGGDGASDFVKFSDDDLAAANIALHLAGH